MVVASAEAFPDALTAAPLAHQIDAPVLLAPRSGLTPAVREEVDRLAPRRAVLLGGTQALGPNVEAKLRELGVGRVDRMAGADRFDTAAQIAGALEAGAETAFIASGTAWPDALSIAPVAARQGSPLLLATRDGLPPVTRERLKPLDVEQAVIVGGSAVMGAGVEHELDQLKVAVDRVAGPGRFSTSYEAVEAGMWSNADARRIWLATGRDWPDALAAAAAVADDGGVLQLVDGGASALAGPAADLLRGWGPEVTRVAFVGGEAVLPAEFEEQSRSLLDEQAHPAEFHVEDLDVDGGSIRVELSPYPGADGYEARDPAGEELGAGEEPVLTLGDDTGAVTVVATDDGEAVAQRDVRLTPFTKEGAEDLRLGASFDGEQVVLDWTASDGPRQARKVVRHRVEETDEGDRLLVDPYIVGYTCGGRAVDHTRDRSEEYAYELLHAPSTSRASARGRRSRTSSPALPRWRVSGFRRTRAAKAMPLPRRGLLALDRCPPASTGCCHPGEPSAASRPWSSSRYPCWCATRRSSRASSFVGLKRSLSSSQAMAAVFGQEAATARASM